jgi:hypothetical protein
VTVTIPAESDLPLPTSVPPEVLETFTLANPFTNEQDALEDQPPPLEDSSLFLTNHHNHTPSISSSSIDVIVYTKSSPFFTSLVAAATAASLLTGSSDPILSSGLAPPNPSIISQINDNVAIPNTLITEISAAGRAERMRHARGTTSSGSSSPPNLP